MIEKQVKAYQFLQKYRNKVLREEYDALLGADTNREASDDILRRKLSDTLSTQLKIARNAGFPVWRYQQNY